MPLTLEAMREAAAKALYENYCSSIGIPYAYWENANEWQRELARKQADAAINAIAELARQHQDELPP